MNIYDSYDINETPNNLRVLVVSTFNTSVSIMSWYFHHILWCRNTLDHWHSLSTPTPKDGQLWDTPKFWFIFSDLGFVMNVMVCFGRGKKLMFFHGWLQFHYQGSYIYIYTYDVTPIVSNCFSIKNWALSVYFFYRFIFWGLHMMFPLYR